MKLGIFHNFLGGKSSTTVATMTTAAHGGDGQCKRVGDGVTVTNERSAPPAAKATGH
jgi:hypothetical protein